MSTQTHATTPETEHPPISARRERTRARLLDAAYDAFAEHGIHATSIEAICERAGFTRGAFYSNFESKEELFLALTDRECRARIASLESAVGRLMERPAPDGELDPDSIGDVIDAILSSHADERRWHLMSHEFELLALRDRSVAQRYLAQERQFDAELAAVLARVAASLGLRFVIAPVDATRLLVNAYTASAREAYLAGVDVDTTQSRRLMARWIPDLVQRLTEPATPGKPVSDGA